MIEILNIALPFFGLILLGVIAGRIWNRGEEGLAWLKHLRPLFCIAADDLHDCGANAARKTGKPHVCGCHGWRNVL